MGRSVHAHAVMTTKCGQKGFRYGRRSRKFCPLDTLSRDNLSPGCIRSHRPRTMLPPDNLSPPVYPVECELIL